MWKYLFNSSRNMDYVQVADAPDVARTPPRSRIRLFQLPDNHELVFDYFCGVPALHVRPCSGEPRTVAAGDSHVPSPQAGGARPFRQQCSRDGEEKVTAVAHILYWARPGEENKVPLLRRAMGSWLNFKMWLEMVGCVGRFLMIRPELEAPRCFTFSSDMVVVYVREQGGKGGMMGIIPREYLELSPPCKGLNYGKGNGYRRVISALAPHTVMF